MKKGKSFQPHGYVVLFCVICLATLLTWIVPAGNYQREFNEAAGRVLVVPGTYTQVESTPVNPIQMITCIFKGFEHASQTVFFTFFAFAYINTIFKTGAMAGALKALLKATKGKTAAIIPIFMIFFMALGTTSGTVEATYGMIPMFIGIATALGYDAMVGLCMVELGVFTGFYCSLMNPFTIGVAHTVSELPMFSGMWYRAIILVVMGTVTIWYVMRYAKKVKVDPSASVVADIDFSSMSIDSKEIDNAQWTWKEKCIIGSFGVAVLAMAVGSIKLGWGTYQYVTLFMVLMLACCAINGMTPNQTAEHFVQSCMIGLFGCFIIGLSRGVLVVLEEGNIVDSIIYYLSLPLAKLPTWAGAESMMLVQQAINFLIPSGSGQAATTMPIMTPLADLLGVNRQVGVLCFMFGDGWSNLLWPTCSVIAFTGIAKIPYQKWLKFWWKLGVTTFILLSLFIYIANAINYGPF